MTRRPADVAPAAACALLAARALARLDPLGLATAALWGTVGLGFLSRGGVVVDGDRRSVVAGLLGLAASAVVPALAGGRTWGTAATVVAVAGLGLATLAAWWLRPWFAILPAARGLTDAGPYGVVRHPMYLGQLVALGAAASALPVVEGVLGFAVAAFAQVHRIREEERVLGGLDAWAAYAARVRWRLVPGVW